MLQQIAPGVWVHEAVCIQTNGVVVAGHDGALLIDPGLTRAELASLADDLRELGLPVVAGFATHPDWDHALWDEAFGDAPRYGTAACAAALTERLAQPDWREQLAEGLPEEIADDVPLDLFGRITGLTATTLPWDGPTVRILEHRAHAPGHAALLLQDARVLVAGDMLSDVLVPMLDLHGADDPVGDYLAALDLLAGAAADVVVPGHGSVGDGAALRSRLDADRAYVTALRDGREVDDPRIDERAAPGWEWVVFIHDGQRERLKT